MATHELPYQPADPRWQSSRAASDALSDDRVFGAHAPHQNHSSTTTTTNGNAPVSQLLPPQLPSASHARPASTAIMYSSPPHPGPSSSSQSPNSRKRASHSITTTTATPPPPLPASMTVQAIPGSPSNSSGGPTDVYSHPAVLAYAAAHPRRKIPEFGPYLLLQTLGEGEFGKVKLGLHSEWGEEVAVKLIRRGSVDSSARMTKVEREIEVLRLIRHPNIVRLYDVIETDKFIGIVLEYASGGELFDHILAHRYLRERDASKLFAQLISGVWYCHKKKIVHRDLKLENLLLDRNRNVIITDFGFANHFEKKANDLMQTSCGSPCYAAPELVISEGLYVGSAVDVWSCGVILYAMLAGYLPFDDDPNNPDGDNINLLYKYIVSTPLTFPDYVSNEARDLLGIMLVPDPKYRATLEQVMAHSWLGAFQPLFKQTVRELEHAAHAQQLEKRQQYQRQMRERSQQQRVPNGSGTPSRNRTTSGYPAAEQFFEDRASAQTQLQNQPLYSTSPSRTRPVTTSVTLASPVTMEEDKTPQAQNTNDFPFIPDYSAPGVSGSAASPTADPRSRKESTRSPSGKQRPSVPPPPSPGPANATAAATSPTSPARNGAAPASPSTEKKRRAPPGQRHTIQLEYDGGLGTTQSTPRASGERTPVATSYSNAQSPLAHEPAPEASPAKPPTTATRKQPTRPDSDGIDTLHYDPFTTEGIPRDLFYEPSPAAVEALQREEEARAPAVSSPVSSPNVPAAPSTPRSVGKAGGANYRSPSMPSSVSPAVVAAISATNDIGGSPSSRGEADASTSSLAPSQATSTGPPATVSRSESGGRHRRGVSMDKFGLSKILGNGESGQHSPQSGPPPSAASATFAAQQQAAELAKAPSGGSIASDRSKPPTTGSGQKKSGALPGLRNRLSGRLSRRQSTDIASVHSDKSAKEKDNLHQMLQQQQIQHKVEEDTTKKRRKTLSLMIDPMAKALPKGMRRGTKHSETPTTSVAPSLPTVLTPIEQSTPPVMPAPAFATVPPRGPPPGFPGTLPSRTPSASTGKAKKVMDWFRKKSLVQDMENENPESTPAPQVVVTDPTSPSARGPAGPTGSSAPPSSWGGQRIASSAAVMENGSGLLQPPSNRPTRSASTREGTEARNTIVAAPPAGVIRMHEGAVDPAAVTSGPSADQIFTRVVDALRSMGVDISRETVYKVQCARPKHRKDGSRQSGLAAFSITGLGGSNGTDRRGLPIPSQSGAGFKGYLFRRGSSQANMPPPSTHSQASTATRSLETNDFTPFTPTTPDPISAHQSTDSVHELGGPPHTPIAVDPVYGKRSEDKGGEVLFSVELTRMVGLSDTYHLDIRRVKGDLKTYQFLYTKVKERCNFRGL